ncbi:MAG: Anthranilate synthase component 2 [Cenarchaeum symbiont of Oopsacas minuta]|nr:Anthranilate synthase component 2 [Cenarchaeum symbiont of Oopsacas minuta]
MKFLIIDNYDSFVYNISQYLGELGVCCDIVRNDALSKEQIEGIGYDAIIISPGPGTPNKVRYFGVCSKIIKECGPSIPILGICLGHQGIISAFGGIVTNASRIRHGKTSPIDHHKDDIFDGVSNPFQATRYHSLAGFAESIPDSLKVIATAKDDGEIMAIRHRSYPIIGVQFHPESIMTLEGKKILENFIKFVKRRCQ